jgi:parallel beta-helix repeat protein
MHPRFHFLAVRLSLLALDVSLVIAGVTGVLSLLGRGEVAFAVGANRYVATTGTDTSTCTSSGSPCRTIQYAVDQSAASGDTILVAAGTYTNTNVRPRNDIVASGSVTQVVYITKTLTLRGGYTTTSWGTSYPITQPTTIDAQNKGRGIYVVAGAAVTVQGFRITQGNANKLGGGISTSDDAGGGVYAHAASLNLRDNTIFSNTAEAGGGVYLNTIVLCFLCTGNSVITNTATISGGGIYIKDSDSTLWIGNTIRANSAITKGGGIFLDNSAATVQDNTIQANNAKIGAGVMLLNSNAVVDNNDILSNIASSIGGGVQLDVSDATLTDNRIYSNTANVGGGLRVGSASGGTTLNRNLIRYNTANSDGGGIDFLDSATVMNNVIADNQAFSKGSGVKVTSSSPVFKHNTFARNTGGDGSAVHATGGATTNIVMTNTVFVTQTVAITVSAGSTVSVKTGIKSGVTSFCGGGGSCSFTTLYLADPLLAADGYHLQPTSPAIDTGLNAGVTTDIDAGVRPKGSAPDIGADEFDSAAASGTRYVAKTGTNTSNDCTVSSTPCLTVQYAVDVAKTNEEVRVAAGTYTGVQVRPRVDFQTTGTVTQMVYITRSVTLNGGYTTTNWTTANPVANVTTLDAQGTGRGIYVAGNITVSVAGLRITRGNAKNQGGQPGLGLSNSAGGGVYVVTATVTLSNNTLTNNDAGNQGLVTTKGGGIFLVAVNKGALSANSIISNTALRGAGGYLSSSPMTLTNNSILSNTAVSFGAGLFIDSSSATVSHNTLMNNNSPNGGGLYVFASNGAKVDSNLITGNSTSGSGAGIYIDNGGGLFTNNVVADNVITNTSSSNAGNGILVFAGSPHFIHTTLARNSGGNGAGVFVKDNGLGVFGSIMLTNTIVFSHSVGISVTTGNTATLNSLLFFGNTNDTGGGGTIISSNLYTGNPNFDTDGYHLTSGSAAIDKGISTSVITDFDDDARPSGSAPDLGADELGAFFIYLPIILK